MNKDLGCVWDVHGCLFYIRLSIDRLRNVICEGSKYNRIPHCLLTVIYFFCCSLFCLLFSIFYTFFPLDAADYIFCN